MDESGITPNTSNQQLILNNGDNDSSTTLLQSKPARRRDNVREVTLMEFLTVAILCFVNLINYMDRFTIAGVLSDVKNDFNIGDDKAGLLQTVFVIAYMVFAPIFGYVGDRYSRRLIMAFGVTLWSVTTMIGSFMENYALFAFFRCLVGIGEASYSTIAPTIISDMFLGNVRSSMLAVFYFAIPVGSGLGYIVGSVMSTAANDWRWGLRLTPITGIVAVILILTVMKDPERGQAEHSHMKATSYKEDMKSLCLNPSFMLATLAFTCVSFVTGALAWWAPQLIALGLSMQTHVKIGIETVSLYFGAITMLSGLIGVPLGTWLGAVLIKRYPRAHPIICGTGLLISAPFIVLALELVQTTTYPAFIFMFIAEVALSLNWAVVADMSLYVVIPPRRSTAEAFQILISHMLGDAGSPYLVGVMSEVLKRKLSSNPLEQPTSVVQFQAMQYALFVTCFVEVIGGVFFLATAIYIVRDKNKVDRAIAEAELRNVEPSHNSAAHSSVGETSND